jgi:hypothetical protein
MVNVVARVWQQLECPCLEGLKGHAVSVLDELRYCIVSSFTL